MQIVEHPSSFYVLDTTAHWVRERRNTEVAKYTFSRATDR